jgi:hypothetical protein
MVYLFASVFAQEDDSSSGPGIIKGNGSDRGDSYIYTPSFFIALGMGAIALLLLIYFLYAFYRKPKDSFQKKVSPKDSDGALPLKASGNFVTPSSSPTRFVRPIVGG